MLIDTGASCSFVRRSFAERLKLPLSTLRERVTVTLADGRTTAATHEVRVAQMLVYGAEAACALLVLDGLSNDVIVGLSWQRAARLSIQLGEQHDVLNGREVVHSKRRTAEASAGAASAAPVRHQRSVEGRVA
ncbi:hypothetical protein MMC15_008687, partial [Xylographa vitiligo]|nr:hypothetical protein [Xylographa vitiligo]